VELTLRTVSRLADAKAFNDLILREDGGQAIRLRDVGRAEIGAENDRSMMKSNGLPTVGVALFPQPGANHIAITDAFYKRMEDIKRDLPTDLETAIGFDTTQFVRKSLFEVTETIFLALLLVTFVIFLFLRNTRTTLIPVIAIPISLIGSFFIMRLSGFSVNILTLLAIVLATGLVVDDAIVVLENIYTRIEKGQDPLQAAREGTREIFFAVISTTVTLAAVFLPILFLEGNSGRLFREFAVVLAGSVIISSFVSLTLTPMMCSRWLKTGSAESRLSRATEPYFRRAVDGYRNSLQAFLEKRWLVFPILIGCFALIVLIYRTLPSELAPLEDRSRVNVSVTAQEGTSFEFMDAFMNQLIDYTLKEIPEIDAVISRTSPGGSGQINTGRLFVNLVDKNQRERSQQEITATLRRGFGQFTDAKVSASEQQTIGDRRARDPVQFVLQAPEFQDLQKKLPLFLEKASQQPELIGVDTDLKFTKPELRLTIDREKARALGISAADIARTLQFNLSETRYGYFIRDGKQYSVIGQLERADRNATANLEALSIRTPSGALVQLGNLVSFEESSTPPQLFRYNRFSSATVNAGLAPGYTLSDGIAAMRRVAAETLDESFTTALSGPARDFAESSSTLAYAFLFALILVYMVLAAQFESFRDPLIVMVTVPLAFTGALISLWYFRQTLNIFSQIGILMLIGLVTKNGILIVEFVNQRKASGLSFDRALLEGAASRFRPIVMTTLTTVLGTLPIALALGAGAESRVSMGIAVIGGLLFSLLLTLYVIPAMYSYLSKRNVPTHNPVSAPLQNTESSLSV
jgi:multidrug efflux pump